MNRRQRVLEFVRPAGRVGVEIGPLARPLILREDGDILYADHLGADDLRRKYDGHPALGPEGVAGIAEVDVVLDRCSLAEALGPRGPVDYVVAAHVIEHIPDPIRWLAEAAEALKADGLVCLVVPDKRFTFDHHRPVTPTGALVAAHLNRLERPPISAIYEQIARACPVHAPAVWKGHRVDPTPYPGGGPAEALRIVREVAGTDTYVDAHCTVFTPHSFAVALAEILALGLIPFACEAFAPTLPNEDEFFVLLRKRDAWSPEARAASVPSLDAKRHHDLPPSRVSAWIRSAARARGL
ncbi:hypothetical protein LKMONMHP_4479 [Methylobacterium organophilum]|uniref:Methyltransferase domain-containing protein n=1 Tax=Methylobacterium organophilum TaxID=410 RepID=A0ABQ4TGW4_METOR|nr:hypothetical protein LKMONMHP_4479 [Methylobacterium organophilum]